MRSRSGGFALRLAVAGALVAAAMMAVGCESSPTGDGTTKPVIKIAHNDWLSAELNDAVAKILLEEQMGYSVQLVDVSTTEQWPDIAKGDIHVSLEVWPSGHPNEVETYLHTARSVENGGLLGPVARVGWYIPTYLLTLHPEFATWEGLKTQDAAAFFSSAQTGKKGRFVGGDPKWVQWDQTIIDHLGLDFTVVFAGSEDAVLSLLDQAYQARAPMLFYFWEPHWAFATHDLTLVELPPYAPDCWANQACAYPSDPLFKIMWPGLSTVAPDAYHFFSSFSYTAQDQVEMMKHVHDGETIEHAARAWIDAHPLVWRAWVKPAG